jgi:hypothetical protein
MCSIPGIVTGGNMKHKHLKKFIFAAIMFASFSAFSLAAVAQTAPQLLVAKFTGKLDSKSAKMGDLMTAKALGTAKLADGTEIPKGSKLIGKVIAVQSKDAGAGTSTLAVRFDQVELKGGGSHPVWGLIVGIGPSADSQAGLGYDSVIGRGGPGSTVGLDPHDGAGVQVNRDDAKLPFGSSLNGVGLGKHMGADGASILRGFRKDILLDSDVVFKIAVS